MSVIALICLYDHRALGLRAISNALQAAGHHAVIVHFKLPCTGFADSFLVEPTHYEASHSSDLDGAFKIRRYNFDVNPWSKRELEVLRDVLVMLEPDIIGVSTRSAYEPFMHELAAVINCPAKSISVAGGFGATFNPDLYVNHFDYVCIGEGELPMLEMADALEEGRPVSAIANLVCKRKGKVIRNEIVLPACEDYLYSFAMVSVQHFVIENDEALSGDILLQGIGIPHSDMASYHLMAGRGCLGDCSFCCGGGLSKFYFDQVGLKKRRMRPLDNVIEELAFAKGYGFERVVFLDSFLVGPKRYLLELFRRYREDIGLPFFAQFYPEQVLENIDVLRAAVEAGLVDTVVGIQSGSERINREIYGRRTNHQKIMEMAEVLATFEGVGTQYHIITHNPFEDEQAFQESLEFVGRLPKRKAEMVLLRLRAFPGTRIADMVRGLGADWQSRMGDFHKRHLLHMLRFVLEENEFLAIQRDFRRLGLEELKAAFRGRLREKDSTSLGEVA